MHDRLGEPLGEPEIACVARQLLPALAYLHAAGTIHRDIKAGNVLLCSNGAGRPGWLRRRPPTG